MSNETTQTSPVRQSYIPLAVITLAHLMAVLDNTIMIVALPSVQRTLGVSAVDRQWIITAYTLAYAGLLLLGGKLADRFGARRTLIVGAVGFALASAAGGLSQTFLMLVAARAVEGAFGAVLTSSTKTLLALTYTEKQQRARAMGVFGAAVAAGGILGMVLGGLITSVISWRWCLFINLPVAALVIILGLRTLMKLPVKRQIHIDLISAAVFCVAISALVYGLSSAAASGWGAPIVLGSLALCALAVLVFGVLQQRLRNPLLPLRLLRDRQRSGTLFASIFDSFGTLGVMLILTFQLQKVQGYSAFATGMTLLPLMLSMSFLSAVIAPRLMHKVAPVWLVAGDVFLSGLGLLPLAFLTAGPWFWPLVIIAEVIEGIGTGLGAAPTMSTTLLGVGVGDVGIVNAVTGATNQMGSSIGTATLNTIAVSVVGVTATGAAMAHGFSVACGYGGVLLLLVSVVAFAIIGAPRRRAR
ncbi:MAG: MFS transporter [Coriobacteriia bacterium]|nr:MFS transporter [Coriobacteriia bacterium]